MTKIEDRKLNGRILVRLRELLPNYLYMNTFRWSWGNNWEAWEANFHVSNMEGKLATLLVGHADDVEGGLFVTLPHEVCPTNEREGYLPSKTRLPLNQGNLDLCIHDYITIRSTRDPDIPQIKWGK